MVYFRQALWWSFDKEEDKLEEFRQTIWESFKKEYGRVLENIFNSFGKNYGIFLERIMVDFQKGSRELIGFSTKDMVEFWPGIW